MTRKEIEEKVKAFLIDDLEIDGSPPPIGGLASARGL